MHFHDAESGGASTTAFSQQTATAIAIQDSGSNCHCNTANMQEMPLQPSCGVLYCSAQQCRTTSGIRTIHWGDVGMLNSRFSNLGIAAGTLVCSLFRAPGGRLTSLGHIFWTQRGKLGPGRGRGGSVAVLIDCFRCSLRHVWA